MAISEEDLRRVVGALDELGQAARNLGQETTELTARIRDHLGVDPATVSSITRTLQTVDRPNFQLAVNEITGSQPDSALIGLSPELAFYQDASLSAVIAGRFMGPSNEVPPVYIDLAIDVDETMPCVAAGLWLLEHDSVPIVLGLLQGERHGPPGTETAKIEIFAVDQTVAKSFAAYLEQLRDKHNVYRGKVLTFSYSEYGDFGVNFSARPDVQADDVILPAEDFASIERHTVGVEQRAAQLRAAGQHLKRGLLLYGPPGSGKTHTIAHLMTAMPERTVVILQGPSIGALGQGAAIVRSLAPSMLVIEDVDLIAADRAMMGPHQGQPLLFQLLNEMDGFVASDDVLFVLTTNRREVLEDALANRPGRIDHAVKIDLPDAEGRQRLLHLYLAGAPHNVDDQAAIIERIAGVTASFVKELIRRATLCALDELGDESRSPTITDAHLHSAIDELQQYMPTVSPEPVASPRALPRPPWE